MFKGFFLAMKSCISFENKVNKDECDVDKLTNAPVFEVSRPNTNSPNVLMKEKANLLPLGKRNSGQVFMLNTFGSPEEDRPNVSIRNSPKFAETTSHSNLNSRDTFENNMMIPFHVTSTETRESFVCKESLNSIKLNKKNLLFTVQDSNNEELNEKVFCMNNIVIMDYEINTAKRLKLRDLEGDLLNSQYLMIDASGLTTSLRKMRDGHTFFGPVADYKKTIVNDFLISCPLDMCKIRLFVIFYERNNGKYYIKSISEKSESKILMYVKITSPYQITSKQYFSMKGVVFTASPTPVDHDEGIMENSIKITVIMEIKRQTFENNSKTYYFDPTQSPITIGRGDCSIKLDYSFLSKKHCTVYFNDKTLLWEIDDGFEGKRSTNGIWLTLNSRYELKEENIIKIGNSSFNVTMIS